MKFLYENEGRFICECESCGMQIKIRKTEINCVGTLGHVPDIECFCGEISGEIKNIPNTSYQAPDAQPNMDRSYQRIGVPHCPTCGSTNVEKISIGSKAVGAYLFGIYSSNIRRTYRCNDCKYRW